MLKMNNILPSLINANKFKNTNDFIEYIYSIFMNDFNPELPQLTFNSKPIIGRPKILNCSNCGNHCNNSFSCQECPFINKLDIFQHICSDEDKNLKILPEYKKKQNRTPGIYNRTRTMKVAWLKFIIENYQNEQIIRYYRRQVSNRELNHFFWLYNEHYILILVEEKNNNKLYIRTCYDLKSDDDEMRHFAHYMRYKNVERSARSTP